MRESYLIFTTEDHVQVWIRLLCPSLHPHAGMLSYLPQVFLQLLVPSCSCTPSPLLPPLQAKAVMLGHAEH